MKTATVHEAKTHLSRLLAEVEQGGEITICRGVVPVARLVPLQNAPPPRPMVGVATSKPAQYTSDCFAPLSEKELKEWGL